MAVLYEQDLQPSGDAPGITAYDDGYPVPQPITKGTDSDLGYNLTPDPVTRWVDLDYEIGGEPGAVNRNAYVLDGMPSPDAHDFRGDHAIIPVNFPYGSYGDAGNSDDYPTSYAQGIASNAYPDISSAESWDAVSEGF